MFGVLEPDGDGLLMGTGQPAMVMTWQGGNLDVEVEVGANVMPFGGRCDDLGIVVGGAEPGIVYRQGNEVPAVPCRSLIPNIKKSWQWYATIIYVYAAGATGAENLSSSKATGGGVGRKQEKSREVRSQLFRIDSRGAAEVLAGSNDGCL